MSHDHIDAMLAFVRKNGFGPALAAYEAERETALFEPPFQHRKHVPQVRRAPRS